LCASLNLLLSIQKEDSFVCRDARIKTRDLEYHNQTFSVSIFSLLACEVLNGNLLQFEELVDQFIPSDMSWKGWVKMALHQPLVPVLPVARELFSKTKLLASKGTKAIQSGHFSDQEVAPSARNLDAHILQPSTQTSLSVTMEAQPTANETDLAEVRRRKKSLFSGPLKSKSRQKED
jgi:hypothetical protein